MGKRAGGSTFFIRSQDKDVEHSDTDSSGENQPGGAKISRVAADEGCDF